MPTFGKESKKKKLLANMEEIFEIVRKKHNLAAGNFPNPKRYANLLIDVDFTALHKISGKTMKQGQMLEAITTGLESTIPQILSLLPISQSRSGQTLNSQLEEPSNPFQISSYNAFKKPND